MLQKHEYRKWVGLEHYANYFSFHMHDVTCDVRHCMVCMRRDVIGCRSGSMYEHLPWTEQMFHVIRNWV